MDTVFSLRLLARPAAKGEEWLIAARRGETWALEAFFSAHHQRVYALCFRMLSRPEDAHDATQSTFIRAFKDLPRFRGDSTVRTWLYRIAVNEALGLLRKRRDQPELPEDCPQDDRAPTVVEQLAVRAALSRMKPDHRTVLVLRFWESLEYEEIAQVLGISLPATKMRLLRAREEFRRCYSEE